MNSTSSFADHDREIVKKNSVAKRRKKAREGTITTGINRDKIRQYERDITFKIKSKWPNSPILTNPLDP